MAESSLLSLPIDLQACIARRVCEISVRDLFSLKITCRAFRYVSELPSVYASANLFDVLRRHRGDHVSFTRRCYEHGNPHAIYLKGSQDYFLCGKSHKGLDRIKLAADKGYTIASYTYAMLRKVFWDDGSQLSRFAREAVRSISSSIVTHGCGWSIGLPAFVDKKEEFNNLVLHSVYSCTCTLYQTWHYWYEDEMKSTDMCDNCFWTREIGIFFEFFGVAYYPDTSDW